VSSSFRTDRPPDLRDLPANSGLGPRQPPPKGSAGRRALILTGLIASSEFYHHAHPPALLRRRACMFMQTNTVRWHARNLPPIAGRQGWDWAQGGCQDRKARCPMGPPPHLREMGWDTPSASDLAAAAMVVGSFWPMAGIRSARRSCSRGSGQPPYRGIFIVRLRAPHLERPWPAGVSVCCSVRRG